ncbi:hypothetical protein H4S06_005994, partial [Coemansia sp. BCRC 34490]
RDQGQGEEAVAARDARNQDLHRPHARRQRVRGARGGQGRPRGVERAARGCAAPRPLPPGAGVRCHCQAGRRRRREDSERVRGLRNV